jgi:hypothetical protein
MANILFINANMGKPEMHKASGGAIRTMNLIEALSEHNVTFFSFGWDTKSIETKVSDNLTYIYAGVDSRTLQLKNRTMQNVNKNPDLCVDLLYKYLGLARSKFQQLLKNTDLVILEHYSGAPFLQEVENIPIIYSSQNCEIFMANQIFGEGSEAAKVTRKMEEFALSKADVVTYCSDEDLNHLQEYYGKNNEDVKGLGLLPNIRVIPHFDRMPGWIPDIITRYLLNTPPGVTLVGIDENTALVGGVNNWTVKGEQSVWVLTHEGREEFKAGQNLLTN